MFKNIFDRQINGKCKKLGSERSIIKGKKCYVKMWEITDKYLSENKRVYLIRHIDKLDDTDIEILNKYHLIFLISTKNCKYLKNVEFLETVSGDLYNVSHVNICYVTPYNLECSKVWSEKVL